MCVQSVQVKATRTRKANPMMLMLMSVDVCVVRFGRYLQHFFNRHVFELELAEYTREGVGDQISIAYVLRDE